MTVRILTGDCMDLLAALPDESVHCVVTSPPYFGLRDYGVPPTAWPAVEFTPVAGLPPVTVPAMTSCMGLEPDPWAFVAHCVAVFREVWRVLRPDGTLWLNLGDSYANAGGKAQPHRNSSGGVGGSDGSRTQGYALAGGGFERPATVGNGLKPKDLMGMPWRTALALQADGWWLRQDIIWSKPNPMPESVRDRCTKAHEYLFMLSKSPRYYFDAEAIAEQAKDWTTGGPGVGIQETQHYGAGNGGNGGLKAIAARYKSGDAPQTRNKRSVWTIATQPFKEAHYATFPPDLVEPCILAGCPEGGTVLDPFGGSGTTGMVASRLHRDAVLIELKPENVAMSERRITRDAPLLTKVAT